MKDTFTRQNLLSTFSAFLIVMAMAVAGCSAGTLAGPDAPQQAPETPSVVVEGTSIEAPHNNENGGGSIEKGAGRNNIGEE